MIQQKCRKDKNLPFAVVLKEVAGAIYTHLVRLRPARVVANQTWAGFCHRALQTTLRWLPGVICHAIHLDLGLAGMQTSSSP